MNKKTLLLTLGAIGVAQAHDHGGEPVAKSTPPASSSKQAVTSSPGLQSATSSQDRENQERIERLLGRMDGSFAKVIRASLKEGRLILDANDFFESKPTEELLTDIGHITVDNKVTRFNVNPDIREIQPENSLTALLAPLKESQYRGLTYLGLTHFQITENNIGDLITVLNNNKETLDEVSVQYCNLDEELFNKLMPVFREIIANGKVRQIRLNDNDDIPKEVIQEAEDELGVPMSLAGYERMNKRELENLPRMWQEREMLAIDETLRHLHLNTQKSRR